jgi:hypothetical protein
MRRVYKRSQRLIKIINVGTPIGNTLYIRNSKTHAIHNLLSNFKRDRYETLRFIHYNVRSWNTSFVLNKNDIVITYGDRKLKGIAIKHFTQQLDKVKRIIHIENLSAGFQYVMNEAQDFSHIKRFGIFNTTRKNLRININTDYQTSKLVYCETEGEFLKALSFNILPIVNTTFDKTFKFISEDDESVRTTHFRDVAALTELYCGSETRRVELIKKLKKRASWFMKTKSHYERNFNSKLFLSCLENPEKEGNISLQF